MLTPAVYAGSFDPVTNGHIDIIRRARNVFGAVIVLVMPNACKRPLFTAQERVELLGQALQGEENVRVEAAEGLLADYLKKNGLNVLVRGLRGEGDLEHELINAYYNKQFYAPAETVFLPGRPEYAFLSSSSVREAFSYGADVSGLVPPCVAEALRRKKRP